MSLVYRGEELGLFAKANNWKEYWMSHLGDVLRGEILEVGAGLGSNLPLLLRAPENRVVCLEPDPGLYQILQEKSKAAWGDRVQARNILLADLGARDRFDVVIYADVLEHIPDDEAEIARAISHLRPGGRLIILAPAHQWLFSPFDTAVGHERRYDAGQLARKVSSRLAQEKLLYLDAAGLGASAWNAFIGRLPQISRRQLRFWDSVLIPISRVLDPLLGFRFGKSILGVWKR